MNVFVSARSLPHFGRLIRLLIAALLCSAFIPLSPERAEAGNNMVEVAAAFSGESAAPGTPITVFVNVKADRVRIPVDVKLRVTDGAGQVVYTRSWARSRLPRESATLNLASEFVVPPEMLDGDVLRASVMVSYRNFTLATFKDAAILEIREDHLPVATPESTSTESVATANPSPTPAATSSPTATETPLPEPTATSTVPPSPQPSPTPTENPAPTTIQAMIDLADAGATVLVPAGTYREKIYITKAIHLLAEPGAIIDGEDRDRWIVGQASNVTIEGFTFINSNQPQYHGGLSNDGHDNWSIQRNVFQDAGNAAIDIKQGSGHLIENNHVSRCGNVGIRVESVGSAIIRGNVTEGNNTRNLDPGWEAGGIKITGNYGGVHNLIIENNEAFGNNGPGIWVDIDGENIEIRNNRVHDNSRAGIIYELSFGGRIHGNVVYGNGSGFDAWGFGAGILIQNSSSTEVSENILAWNADGIAVMSQNRGEVRWSNVTGNTVHNNTIIANHDGGWNTYGLAWLEDWDGVLADPASNNRGYANQFWFSTDEGPELRYRWCAEAYWTVSDFNNSPGGQGSRYLTTHEKDQILASAGI